MVASRVNSRIAHPALILFLQESLAVLGLSAEGHSLWMIGNKRNNADGRHIYYPTAALVEQYDC
jgi:hypothetical protein